MGCDRLVLAILDQAYEEETLENGDTREVLHLHPYLAPYKVAILPLMKKYHSEKAKEICQQLSKEFFVTYDETGSIGKRYRRQDAIGTPYCVTIDEQTLENGTVTIRERDTMQQEVIALDALNDYIKNKIKF